MATGTANTAPPPSPVGRDYPDPGVEHDRYVEHQLNRTRVLVKLVDLASGLGALAAGLLGLLLALVLIDHWVFGLGFWTRWFGLLLLVGGSSYFFIRRLLPLFLRSVNPVYAARTIEQSEPSLKNSLINFLLFRSHRTEVRQIVYDALREKAAADLRRVPVDMAVDRSKLIKVGCVLAGVLTAALVYTLFWPDGTWRTVRRVMIPWANLDRPAWSWVRIENVRWRVDAKEDFTPGDATVFQGQSVTIAATVRRAGSSDSVTLFYTTDDGRNVRRKVPMARGRAAADFECMLPPGDDGQGVQQNVTYSIEAGDAVSREYRIDVLSAPSIIVEKIDYDYPDYTNLPGESVRRRGDIKALEGTRVTIHARANHPIKSAYVEFDPGRSSRGGPDNPGKQDRPETLSIRDIDGQEARVSFKLRLKPDRQTPKYARYRIRFTTDRGERNEQPIEHLIAVIPDLPPLVEILTPTKQTIEVPQDGRQPIKIRAVDPDFRLRRIVLKGTSEGAERLEETLLDAPEGYPGQKIVAYQFVPQKLRLAVGDQLRYWAVAEDNRTSPIENKPEPNISRTEPDYVIRILPPQGRQPGDADRPDEEAGSPQQDDSTRGSEDQGGASGASESGDSESGDSQSGDSQSGKSESGGSEAGDTNSGAGESGGSETGDNNSGASQSGGDKSGGGQSGDAASGDSTSGQSKSGGSQSGENSSGENQSGGDKSGGSKSGNDKSGVSDSAGSDAAGSKSAAGDQRPLGTGSEDDVDVFDRVRRHMRQAEQRAGSLQDSSGRQGGGDAEKGSGEARQAEKPGTGNSGAEEGKPPDGNTGEGSANKPSTSPGDESPGDQGEDGKSGDSDTGSTDEQDPGEAGAGQKENGGSGSPDAQAENNPRQKKMEPGPADERSSGDAANSPSNSRRQSDSSKGEKGDKSGGGGPGGGQDAKQPGNENPGSTSPGDDGSGAAGEPGAGEESDAAGGSRIADKPTGAAGDAPGEGSGGRPGDKGGSPGGNSAGDAGGDRSDDSHQDEAAPEGKQPRNLESGSGGADQGRPADRQEQSPTGRGSGLPTGGGLPGDTQTPRVDAAGGEPGGDEADLESARKATDLTLEYLKDQEDHPDRELLEKLGWTKDDIRKFVSRWERMKEAALRRGGEGEQAKKELDDALRSLGLDTGPDRLRRSAGNGADVGGSRDAGHRSSPPPQYTEQFRAYRKAAARVDQADRE